MQHACLTIGFREWGLTGGKFSRGLGIYFLVGIRKWAHQGSNLGPTGYEPVALPAELWARYAIKMTKFFQDVKKKAELTFQKALEQPTPAGVPQFPQCLGLDLPYPFPCDIEILSHLFQRMICLFSYPKPHPQDLFFPGS